MLEHQIEEVKWAVNQEANSTTVAVLLLTKLVAEIHNNIARSKLRVSLTKNLILTSLALMKILMRRPNQSARTLQMPHKNSSGIICRV